MAGSGSRSELPVLEPLSPTMSRAGNLNEQYEFLRRTLSHSRHRYSTRRSRPPPPRGSRGDGDRGEDRGVGETRLSRGFAAAGREARTVSHLKERANPKHNSSKGILSRSLSRSDSLSLSLSLSHSLSLSLSLSLLLSLPPSLSRVVCVCSM